MSADQDDIFVEESSFESNTPPLVSFKARLSRQGAKFFGGKKKGGKKKDDDDTDHEETVNAGVEAAVALVELSEDQSVENIANAFTAIGTIAMFCPPPGGPAVGGALMMAGGLMTIFGPKKPEVPSAELLAI